MINSGLVVRGMASGHRVAVVAASWGKYNGSMVADRVGLLKGEPNVLWMDLPCGKGKLPTGNCFDHELQEQVLSSWEDVPWAIEQLTSSKPLSIAVPGSQTFKHKLSEHTLLR